MSKAREATRTPSRRPPSPARPRPRRRRRLVWVAVVIAMLAAAAGGARWLATSPVDPDQLWLDAEMALNANQIDQAAELLRRLSAARPPRSEDWMLRGQVATARQRPDEAIAHLRQVAEDHPFAAQAWLLIGQIELRRNRARFAEAALLKAAQLDPTLQQAHRELIYIYGVQLRRRELGREFAALSELTDLSYDSMFHWCLTRGCLWEPGEVAKTLDAYLDADPDDLPSRLALADNYRRLGLYDEAAGALAPLSDENVEALAGRILIALDRHQEDRAEEMLEAAPADNPRLARIRGRIALARRNGPEAVHQYRLAFADEPGNRDALFGLINALELNGDSAAAAPLRRDAKLMDQLNTIIQRLAMNEGRTDPKLPTDAAEACAAVGLIPEARGFYRLAIARNPLDSASQQALYRLNEKFPPGPPAGGPVQANRD